MSNPTTSRAIRDGSAALLGLMAGLVASLALTMAGFGIFPYQAPSVCGTASCQATGAVVVFPNAFTLGVQLQGPAPGIEVAAR